MRIIRYKYSEEISYGILKNEEIYSIEGDIFENHKADKKIGLLKDVELLAPVEPPNIIAIGLNYRQHAVESGSDIPEKPVIFLKATTSITGPDSEIVLPKIAAEEVDYEAELAVVIAKEMKNTETVSVSDHILGYTCANDVSARDCQRRLDKQWARAKSFDTFCPLGPWIETDLDPNNLKISSILNGKVMQDSHTSDMIFDIEQLLSYISHNMTLKPGTVIITGTPEGVGFARKEPVFLREDDEIEIKIEGIGSLKNKVKKEK
ncbi:MAG: fumarylacetoacetate hydrolase family protein [Halanaerobium sp.]